MKLKSASLKRAVRTAAESTVRRLDEVEQLNVLTARGAILVADHRDPKSSLVQVRRSKLDRVRRKAANIAWDNAPVGTQRLLEELDGEELTAHQLEQIAFRCQRTGEVSAAVAFRRQAVEREPQSAARHIALAMSLAAPHREGVRNDVYLGLIHGQVAAMDEAIAAMRAAAQLNPGNPHVLFQLGSWVFENGSAEEGLEFLERAVALRPKASSWLRKLADCYRKPHVLEFAQALRCYECAFELNRGDAKALSGIANVGGRVTMDWSRVWFSARLFEKRRRIKSPYVAETMKRLDTLFSEEAGDAEVKAALNALDTAASGHKLHPVTMDLVTFRIQFLGHLAAGFELRKDKAQRDAQRKSRTAAQSPAELRQYLRARAYLGQHHEAAAEASEILAGARHKPERLAFQRLDADAHLLAGDVQPYIRHMAELRKRDPLPGDQEMRELVRGKRVAIVGPADSGESYGHEIDGFDLVVRPRFQPDFIAERAETLGSRSDIAYFSARDLLELKDQTAAAVESGELKLAVGRSMSHKHLKHLDLPWLRFYRQEFSLYYHGSQLGIQRIAYDLLQFDPSEICLFNVDFYAGSSPFTRGYRDGVDVAFGPGSILNDLVLVHDLRSDFAFMKSLKNSGRLTARGVAQEVLSLSTEEYLQKLESESGLRGV